MEKRKWGEKFGLGGDTVGSLSMLLFSFYSVIFKKNFSILSSTLLQHSIFEASEGIFRSDVQNTSTTE